MATKKDFDDFKKEKEWELNLNGGDNWTYEKSVGAAAKFKQNGNNEKQPDMNKDIVFSGGGTIDVKADMDLLVSSQVGGLVFKKNGGSGETTYTIKSTDKKGFNGSGLDIEENVKVVWGLGFIDGKKSVNDALHKVQTKARWRLRQNTIRPHKMANMAISAWVMGKWCLIQRNKPLMVYILQVVGGLWS